MSPWTRRSLPRHRPVRANNNITDNASLPVHGHALKVAVEGTAEVLPGQPLNEVARQPIGKGDTFHDLWPQEGWSTFHSKM